VEGNFLTVRHDSRLGSTFTSWGIWKAKGCLETDASGLCAGFGGMESQQGQKGPVWGEGVKGEAVK
jgi:hypothetical protein